MDLMKSVKINRRKMMQPQNVQPKHSVKSVVSKLEKNIASQHAPKVLVLYGSLRQDSLSRKLANEAVSILEGFGAEVRLFDPRDLPVFDVESTDHPKVIELRQLALWAEAHVWISPEIHGNLSGAMKNQIDWIPLSDGAVRPTQGKTLAVMQISGGSQSFNAVNSLRVLGRWMRMFTIPNQSSIAMAWQEFDEQGRLKPSAYRERVVDVLEELFKVTLLMRGQKEFLTERFSEQQQEQPMEVPNAEALNLVALVASNEESKKASKQEPETKCCGPKLACC